LGTEVTYPLGTEVTYPVHPDHQISEHNSKWTNDHPLENIIGELARPVSTRLQLHEQALFCYYDAFLTAVEPKTYKDALTQSCWIEAMQEELNERIIKTIHVDFDELTAMAFEHISLGPALHEMTPTTICSGLVPNIPPSTPFIPPSRSYWYILFQPLFDELLTPPPSVD
nr:integrase, catalytic region, zinc finger, CCHC-type, peptidase aspartic, catalytic [Tanacetum cinerariifolium]